MFSSCRERVHWEEEKRQAWEKKLSASIREKHYKRMAMPKLANSVTIIRFKRN